MSTQISVTEYFICGLPNSFSNKFGSYVVYPTINLKTNTFCSMYIYILLFNFTILEKLKKKTQIYKGLNVNMLQFNEMKQSYVKLYYYIYIKYFHIIL